MVPRRFRPRLFRRCRECGLATRQTFTLIVSSSQILTTVAGGSRGIGYIYAGRVVSGVGIGGISAVAPAYVSECSPKDVRGRITGLFQIMVAIGVMISYFINRALLLAYASSCSHRCLSSRCGAAHGQYPCRVANSLWFPARSCWVDVSRVVYRQGKTALVLESGSHSSCPGITPLVGIQRPYRGGNPNPRLPSQRVNQLPLRQA